MSKYYGNVVLVTGASSGIGKAIAQRLSQKGYKVYGTSRKPCAETDENAGQVKMLQMDVTNEESVKAAIDKIIEAEGQLGILINNAGMGIAGAVEDTSYEEALLQFDTNFFGTHRVIRHVLPHMRKRGRGLIVNMSSVGAVFPIPYQAMYVASKAALEGMSGCLRNELMPFGIKVSVVQPGDARTGFTQNRVFVKAADENSPYAEYCKKSVSVMERDEMNGYDPDVVAKAVEKIIKMKNPPLTTAVGIQYKLFVFMKRLVSRRLETFIVSRMYKG